MGHIIEHSAATTLMEEQIAFENKCILSRLSAIDKWKLDNFITGCIAKLIKINSETLNMRFNMKSPDNPLNINWKQANAYIKIGEKPLEMYEYARTNEIYCGAFVSDNTIVVIASKDSNAYEQAVIRETSN